MTEAERVLITGAASGLGAALAEAWEARGARVLRTDRALPAEDGRQRGGRDRSELARRSVPETRSAQKEWRRLDITSDADWAGALAWVEQEWGGLDVLVNNAGIAGGGRLDVAGIDEWHRLVEINLLGAVRGTATFTPLFKRQGSGRIVNVASLAGLVHPAGMAGYNATKAAVVALTETTGHELAAHGVTAHVVCPSYFRTNLMASVEGNDAALATVMSRLVEDSPIGPEQIATAVLDALDRGEELILPDEAARGAYQLKQADRASYDQVMRAQARKLEEIAGETK